MPEPSNRFRLSARSGFTLMEALIVVILLGVISSMALPSIARSMTSTRADRAAYTVVADIEAAFALAARERMPVLLEIDSINQRIVIRDRATSKILQQRSYSPTESDFGLTRLATNGSNLTIFPNGLASSAFTVYAYANQSQRAVRVRRTGQMRVTLP